MSANRSFYLSIFFVALIASAQAADQCHVLALEGGGSNGAFQAGAVHSLINSLPKEDVRFMVVSGISTGTLNSIGFATHAIGDEVGAAEFLVNLWSEVTQKDVWTKWDLGVVEGLLHEGGIYNSAALGDFLEKVVPENHQQRPVYMGTDNLNDGKFTINYNMDFNREDYLLAVRSSAAAPFVFPPITWDNPVHGQQSDTDGGTKMNLNLLSAITHCKAQGFEESDIVVDAVMCFTPAGIPTFDPSTQNTTDMVAYVKNMYLYNFLNNYPAMIQRTYPEAQYRYLLYPLKEIPSNNPIVPLNFSQESIQKVLKQGMEDGQEIVSWGPGVSWKKFVEGATSDSAQASSQMLSLCSSTLGGFLRHL